MTEAAEGGVPLMIAHADGRAEDNRHRNGRDNARPHKAGRFPRGSPSNGKASDSAEYPIEAVHLSLIHI